MTKQQEDLIKGMFEAGKVAEAQNEIFEVLKTNGIDGNADATAALADQWEQSKNVLEDIVVDLGNAIAGMFGLNDGSTKLSDSFKTLRDSIKEVIDTGFFKELGTVMVPILKHVAKLTVVIGGGLAMMAAAAGALLSGKGFDAAVNQINAIDKAMKKTILSINKFGTERKKAGEEDKKGAKNQVDANAKLKAAIANRIKALKAELVEKKKTLKDDEKTLVNMKRVLKAVQAISNVQKIGLEDRFTQRSSEAVKAQQEALEQVIKDDITAQKAEIKGRKQDIKTLESKLRAEGIQKAAAQQIKNQEIQIQLQKESNQLQKQQSGGSVFSNE
jgi:hypothetical protein